MELKSGKWLLDNGCLIHMTGDKSLFSRYKSKGGGYVTFGDNTKCEIFGISIICTNPYIEIVYYARGLKV